MKTKVSEETLTALNGLKSEITAGMVMFPKTSEDRTWNDCSNRALRILKQYIEGDGLFQQPSRKDDKEHQNANQES